MYKLILALVLGAGLAASPGRASARSGDWVAGFQPRADVSLAQVRKARTPRVWVGSTTLSAKRTFDIRCGRPEGADEVCVASDEGGTRFALPRAVTRRILERLPER